jgi:hypothetical protein
MKTYKVTVNYGGTTWYNEEGQIHREGGLPAFESNSGNKFWYINGKLHGEGGLPAVEFANGDKLWYINGQRVTEAEAIAHFKPKAKELTMQELTSLLGYEVKIIK